jgi:hypothetical protein
MIALTVWLARLVIVYVVLKMVWSLFFKKKGPSFSRKPQDTIKRFKADAGKVEDADFKEL